MQAIQVKHIESSDPETQLSSVKAWTCYAEAWLIWDDSIATLNYRNAALALLKQLDWKGAWIGAELPTGDYAFLCVDFDSPLIVGA